jgi:hypothetical protein
LTPAKVEDKRKMIAGRESNFIKDIDLTTGNDNILPFEFLNKKKTKILKKAA